MASKLRKRTRRNRSRRRYKSGGGRTTVDLVISRYKESLEWLIPYLNLPFRTITIYNKGPDMTPPPVSGKNLHIIPLENVGMCDHTYMYHIVENYRKLANITVFIPGSSDISYKASRVKELIESAFKNHPIVYGFNTADGLRQDQTNFHLDTWSLSGDDNRNTGITYNLHPALPRPFGTWFDTYMPGSVTHIMSLGGIFSASKEMIHKNPIQLYKIFLDQLDDDRFPEVAHYVERIWAALFEPLPSGVFKSL